MIGVAAITATGATGCATVSPQQEVAMGQQYAAEINQQLPIVNDATVNRYIRVLGDSLARTPSRADLDWQFYIVDSPEVNAFAVPGGFIYLNRGLIERAKTMSEVAGVLGHEIGHVVQRHSVEQMQKQQNANIGLTLGCILAPRGVRQPGGRHRHPGGRRAVFARFSRKDEQEADAEGVRMTVARRHRSARHPVDVRDADAGATGAPRRGERLVLDAPQEEKPHPGHHGPDPGGGGPGGCSRR
jgi:predicted Zn-dependent protease